MALTPYRSFGLLNLGPSQNPSDDDQIKQWKRQIGFNEEPVQNAQGFWTIGYGQQLGDTPGGPKPYATVSEPIADEELRYFVAQGGDPNTRVDPEQETNIEEQDDVPSPTGPHFEPGQETNYRGHQIGIQGNPSQEDIDAIIDGLPPERGPISSAILRGANDATNAIQRATEKIFGRKKRGNLPSSPVVGPPRG